MERDKLWDAVKDQSDGPSCVFIHSHLKQKKYGTFDTLCLMVQHSWAKTKLMICIQYIIYGIWITGKVKWEQGCYRKM